MQEWFNLPENDRKFIIDQVSNKTNLLSAAIEKDWWVMIALRAIFNTCKKIFGKDIFVTRRVSKTRRKRNKK